MADPKKKLNFLGGIYSEASYSKLFRAIPWTKVGQYWYTNPKKLKLCYAYIYVYISKQMAIIPIFFEITTADAAILAKYKKEDENESEAAERLLYEYLSRLETTTEEERTLEGIYVKLSYLQRSLTNMAMLLPRGKGYF